MKPRSSTAGRTAQQPRMGRNGIRHGCCVSFLGCKGANPASRICASQWRSAQAEMPRRPAILTTGWSSFAAVSGGVSVSDSEAHSTVTSLVLS